MKSEARSVTDENQDNRLDQDIDKYTRKLELERKRKMNLKLIHQETQRELNKLKQGVADARRQSQENKARLLSAKEKTSAARIDICNVKSDHIIGEINELKLRIDALRRERTQFLRIFKEMDQQASRLESEAETAAKEADQHREHYHENQRLIAQELERSEALRSQCFDALTTLNMKISRKGSTRDRGITPKEFGGQPFDTAQVLKKRLQKLILNNKEKVRIIDVYQRNMGMIDQAFNSIKEATGLTDIQQIQNTFIKSEEQNCGLLTYYDIINQEIDFLHEENAELERRCTEQGNENADRLRILQGTPDEEKRRRKVNLLIDRKAQAVYELANVLKQLQPCFQQVLQKYSQSVVETDKVKQFSYRNGITLNESNFQEQLAQFQTYVDRVLQFRAKRQKVSLFIAEGLVPKDREEKREKPLPALVLGQSDEDSSFLSVAKLKEQAKEALKSKGEGDKKKKK